MDGFKKSAGTTSSCDGSDSKSEYCAGFFHGGDPPRQHKDAPQLQREGSHEPCQDQLSDLPGHRDILASQRDPTPAPDDQDITRVVLGPSQWSADATDSHVCGDILPENWHRRKQKRSEEVGKIVGPQVQEQAGEPHAQTQRSSDDVFIGPAQRQPQTFQSLSPELSPTSSPRSHYSLSPGDYLRPRSFWRNCATGSEGKLPFVGLGRGPFLKLTQSPPTDVTRSPSKPRASSEVKQKEDIKDSDRPSFEDEGLKYSFDDKHEPPNMLGASRWAPPSGQGDSNKDESQKRPLIEPSKWATVDSSAKGSTRLSIAPAETRRCSPSNRGSARDASIRLNSLQTNRPATADSTSINRTDAEAGADSGTKKSQHHGAGRNDQTSPTHGRGKHYRGRKPRPKLRNSVHTDDVEGLPVAQAAAPPVAVLKATANSEAQPTTKSLGVDNGPVPTAAKASLSVPSSDHGLRIRGHANRSRSRSSYVEDTARNQGVAAVSAASLTSANEEHGKPSASSASPATADTKLDFPRDSADIEPPSVKQDEGKDSSKATSSVSEKATANQSKKVEAPSEISSGTERRRRPSATYIPPHLRRRMQEEKIKQQAGAATTQSAPNTPPTFGAADGIQIKGRDGRQPTTSQRQFGDASQHGYDMFPHRYLPSGAVGISPQGPMPLNMGPQRFSVPAASSYPGHYNRQSVQPQVGGYHMPNTSRTAYASVNMPSQTPGVLGSWDQRFSQSPNLSAPHHQGQGPHIVPQHHQAQPRSMLVQQSYVASSPASSYPPLTRGMVGQQFGQQLSRGRGFLQPSKHAMGPQASSASPLTQTRHPEGFEQVSQNHLRYNPHHVGTPPQTTTHPPVETSGDDLAARMTAIQIHDKSERDGSGAGQWRIGNVRGKTGQHSGSERSLTSHMPGQADDDLKAQAEERERNRLRKLQAARSRGWDSRKTQNGPHTLHDSENDPERLALRNGPDRVREDMERRRMLLSSNDNDEDDGTVYPEPGRLEPIDFGDEFGKKDDKANKPESDVSSRKEKDHHPPNQKTELTPLPDVIEPGTSWADLMDEEDWHQ
ncbi:hypothetical protein KEM54_000006 [Ascosphaera aggregata]|nr:hypothetical protein KEM54_000006 [Ascosphaera aggregata]